MKRAILAVVLAGLWITLSEFVRNELIFKYLWVGHFNSLGLSFETTPLNGAMWMVWSFGLAYLIFRLLRKFSWGEALLLAWMPAFMMMWIVIFNLQVLPLKLILFAVPLSVLEVAVGGYIIRKCGG